MRFSGTEILFHICTLTRSTAITIAAHFQAPHPHSYSLLREEAEGEISQRLASERSQNEEHGLGERELKGERPAEKGRKDMGSMSDEEIERKDTRRLLVPWLQQQLTSGERDERRV